MGRGDQPILLVEDNEADDILIRRELADTVKNQIVTARDGTEALELLHGETRIEPTLVLLDLAIPPPDGFAILKAIRANPTTAHLSVVVMTNSDNPNDIANAYALGANDYVVKPAHFKRFVDDLRRVVTQWTTETESG